MKKKVQELFGMSNKPRHLAVALVLCFAVLVAVICTEYYNSLQRTIFQESSSYISELSKQMGANTSKLLDDNYAVLGTVKALLQETTELTYERFHTVVAKQKEYWNFLDIMLVDQNNVIYNSSGKSLTMPSNDFLSNAIVTRQPAMSSSQVIDGEECVVFVLPVDGLRIGDVKIVAICSSYRRASFDNILTTSAFDGQAYTHIIDNTGAVAVRSNSAYAPNCGYNLLSYLESTVAQGGQAALQSIKNNIQQGSAGIAVCNIDGTESYLSYRPLSNRSWCLVTFVPLSVANAKSNILLYITIVFCVFIVLVLLALALLLVGGFFRYKHKLETIAFVDPVTKGDTLQKFQLVVAHTLQTKSQNKYAMVYINIEKFKVLNDQFGRQTGDLVLRMISNGIRANLADGETVARVMADQFCAMVEYDTEEQMAAWMDSWRDAVAVAFEENGLDMVMPSLRAGIYVINVASMPIPFMVDRAKLSLGEAQGRLRCRVHYSLYDERRRDQLFREKQLEDRMEHALATGEFEVYLQPKYLTETRVIGGAEALIRWHGEGGKMIFPDEFIPLFERNGFISQIDQWVFEQVCKTLRRWIDAGIEPVPISLNCSRFNLNRMDFVESYCVILEKYQVPASLIEVELTESVVYEDTQRLLGVIEELHAIGFKCSIDDFGSGYSSLNMIQDIPVDVLKLDKIFFRNTRDNNLRANSVIGGIVNMAQALAMLTVAEGVEHEEQIEMLRGLGCTLIQGYVFSKPIPIPDFEKLANYDR